MSRSVPVVPVVTVFISSCVVLSASVNSVLNFSHCHTVAILNRNVLVIFRKLQISAVFSK